MEDPKPLNLYILHGDDEYAIDRYLDTLKTASQEVNIIRLDGRTCTETDFNNAVATMAFFAEQRLVIYSNPLVKLTSETTRQRFLKVMENLADTTTLALVIDDQLEKRGRDRDWASLNAQHWMIKWAAQKPGKVEVHAFPRPDIKEMPEWVRKEAVRQGGKFAPAAASMLSAHLGNETRLAAQEIAKLLMYVNFNRAVEADDVELLTPSEGPVSIFDMVDAMAIGDGKKATGLLHHMMGDQEPQGLFAMIVRQFRLLLQVREILDEGGNAQNVVQEMRQAPFVAEKLVGQARRFNIRQLEDIYRRLLQIDEDFKTSQAPLDTSLDLFVVSLAR
ncbi:MAG: DNA polymerase III subunit delta [Anaerolineaceae bacterium]|nr:DNA polymerase III subunit delta [Anaerolineaceae bacterium]